jgi:hypothetical protein
MALICMVICPKKDFHPEIKGRIQEQLLESDVAINEILPTRPDHGRSEAYLEVRRSDEG